MVSKHSHMPGAGRGRQQVNSLQASLSLVGGVLAAYHWSRNKMPISVCVMFAPLMKPQKKGMQFYPHPACIRRAQKDQTEQNRGLERIVSQTQRLLLGLDTVCLVTIYLCNHQAQRSLFIKGPLRAPLACLTLPQTYKDLRSVQRIKDWTLFIVLLMLGGWL